MQVLEKLCFLKKKSSKQDLTYTGSWFWKWNVHSSNWQKSIKLHHNKKKTLASLCHLPLWCWYFRNSLLILSFCLSLPTAWGKSDNHLVTSHIIIFCARDELITCSHLHLCDAPSEHRAWIDGFSLYVHENTFSREKAVPIGKDSLRAKAVQIISLATGRSAPIISYCPTSQCGKCQHIQLW